MGLEEAGVSGTDPQGVDHSLMTLRQAAERTGMSATTLRRYIKAGRLRARLIPGRYGPEYVVDDDDLSSASLLNGDGTQTGTQSVPARRATSSPPRSEGNGVTASTDVVPGLLYRELLMKHEHLLVQYGMLRVSGRQLYEVRQEAENKAQEARHAAKELRRIRDRHAGEIGLLKTQLRRAELTIAEKTDQIDSLRRRLGQAEMQLRNATTSSAIDERFSRDLSETPEFRKDN